MAEHLGFNTILLGVLIGGIAFLAIGQLVEDMADFQDDVDKAEDTMNTGNLLMNLGMIAGGAAVLLAGIRAEKANTVLRAIMIILGVAILFSGFSIDFIAGGGFGF